ncbi:hypothetical protein CYMTET_27666 [Cymbomonas tetramitiformis]|uniref:Uncharacterized protein n=1 Tax=Cymbomonas tetramitiformis TaxID=36881 RepID=A0AAE0FPA9_9CHLO|nr:hypothetical protein CYMTET_27666 [Cymbomonas tetramitiformis]
MDSKGLTFEDKDGLWTWSLVDKGVREPLHVESGSAGPCGTQTRLSLGDVFSEMVKQEKERVEAVQRGASKKMAQRWLSRRKSGQASMAENEHSGSDSDEAEAGGAGASNRNVADGGSSCNEGGARQTRVANKQTSSWRGVLTFLMPGRTVRLAHDADPIPEEDEANNDGMVDEERGDGQPKPIANQHIQASLAAGREDGAPIERSEVVSINCDRVSATLKPPPALTPAHYEARTLLRDLLMNDASDAERMSLDLPPSGKQVPKKASTSRAVVESYEPLPHGETSEQLSASGVQDSGGVARLAALEPASMQPDLPHLGASSRDSCGSTALHSPPSGSPSSTSPLLPRMGLGTIFASNSTVGHAIGDLGTGGSSRGDSALHHERKSWWLSTLSLRRLRQKVTGKSMHRVVKFASVFAHRLSGRSIQGRRKKKRKATARELLSLMGINLFRLQLCIPLDYLEEEALAELHDVGRRERRDGESAQANTTGEKRKGKRRKKSVGEELLSTVQLLADQLTGQGASQGDARSNRGRRHRAGFIQGKAQRELPDGVADSDSRPVTEAFQDEEKEDTAQINTDMEEDQDGDEMGSAVKTRGANLLTKGIVASKIVGLTRGSKHTTTLGRRMWRKLQLRQMELPVERMLGTAITQAFLCLKAILSKQDLDRQMALANDMPWQMPNNRPFEWYVSVFKVLITSMSRNGWYQRSHLWNLIFLQRVDGSFQLSHHLATVLNAGIPLEDLEVSPVSKHARQPLLDTLPPALAKLYTSPDSEHSPVRGEEVWATILVLEQLKNYPYSWTENPEEDARKQVTLRGRSEMFIEAQVRLVPLLGPLLPELQDVASARTEDWEAEHMERIELLYKKAGGNRSFHRDKESSSGWRFQYTWHQRMVFARRLWRRCARLSLRKMRWLAMTHPLGAIYLVRATDPFSRSERIIIQANTFILMLVFTVWFYFSHAQTCCQDRRDFTGCPEASDVRAPCLGFHYCVALQDAVKDGLTPEELGVADFMCTAFPENTFAGRISVIMIIVGILTPVTLLLNQMFIMASGSAVPAHWGTFPARKLQGLFGPGPTAVLQTATFTIYALFFNFQKFNKAVAVTFVALFSFLIKPRVIQSALRASLGTLYWIYTQARAAAVLLSPPIEPCQSLPLAPLPSGPLPARLLLEFPG